MCLQPMTTNVPVRVQPMISGAESSGVVLDEQEEQIIQGILHEERGHLDRLNQEIRRLESTLMGLYKEQKIRIGRVDRYSLSLAPHKRLPSELLARIFLELRGGQPVALPPNPDESPWIIQRVCSQWRKVAREEGRLWSDLNLEDQPSGRAEDIAVTWIPRLWSRTHSFPVSVSLPESTSHDGVAIRDVLGPYYHRMQRLSLYTHPRSFPSILVGHSFPFNTLESLIINFRPDRNHDKDFFPTEGQLVTAFTSTKLKKAVFTDFPSSNENYLHRSYKLPWSQLTHLTFRMVQASLEPILRQCNNLVSLTFTSGLSKSTTDDRDTNTSEIFLPHLQSITMVIGDNYTYHNTFSLLRVPFLKEVTFDNSADASSDYRFSHAGLISMVKRSGSSITSLSLLGGISAWKPKEFLKELPDLVRLIVSVSRHIPNSIFDMMGRGEILQKLEHLECLAKSPVRFLELLEHQCMFPSSEHHGISTAKVSYDERLTANKTDEMPALYERLKEFERCGKRVTLKGIDLDLSIYWDDYLDSE